MELLNQPLDGQLGERLFDLLEDSEYKQLNMVVAFAKTSGVLRIQSALKKFRDNGGYIRVFLGIDLGGTSYEALKILYKNVDELSIVHTESTQTYHPKVYNFVGLKKITFIVGSNNLTAGGLWQNFESAFILTKGIKDLSVLQTSFNKYLKELSSLENSIRQIKREEDIDQLLETGYIQKEVTIKINKLNQLAGSDISSRPHLFGQLDMPKLPKAKSGIHKGANAENLTTNSTMPYRTMWIESQRMTGGSRNILDLSMKAKLKANNSNIKSENDFVAGSIEFFDIKPQDTATQQNITLNFEGENFAGNTLLFPTGARSNGTWRLQIKGVSASGKKITEVFKEKEGITYLQDKILVFTKISSGLYEFSVLPISELSLLETISKVLAYNGKTCKSTLIGFF